MKTAIVTGCDGRIGEASCVRLKQAGYNVVGIDVGDKACPWPHYVCDISDPSAFEDTLSTIEREHGLVEALFNNAGLNLGGVYTDLSAEQFDRTIAVNVRAPVFAIRWVAARLIAAGRGGAIVNNTSNAGHLGSTVVEYGASKAALMNVTKSLGKALGRHGIRVNAVAPGLIETAMGARVPQAARERSLASALGRIGQPEEVAEVVHFLLSDAASFMTCAIVDVNGGA